MEGRKWIFGALVVIVIGSGVLWLIVHANQVNTQKSFELDVKDLRYGFLLKNVWMRQAQNKAQYKDEISALTRSYFKDMRKLYEKYERSQDLDAKWKEYEKGGATQGTPLSVQIDDKADKKSAEDRVGFKEAFEYAKLIYALLQEARYDPVFTDTKESVRIDFYKLDRMGDKVRWSFIIWGALPEMRYTGMEIKLFDAEGKHYGTMHSASSQPNLRVDNPSIWIEDFPPGATPGYYELPLIPYPAAKMDLTFNMSGRSYYGSSVAWAYEFKELPVEPSWKMSEGAKWEAQAVEVPIEETVAEQEAAAKGKAPKGKK
ncbi:MAG: hypothetical protein HY897_08125 [Deltaproteobacteria bacterium]|nr:hypothetical protein [Deltaproteobacteria bacterium]